MIRKLLPICAVMLSAILIGCGGGGGGGASSLGLTEVKVDEGRAVKKILDDTGGVVTATGADATIYTLTIPAGALMEETEIGLYPISSLNKPLFAGST